MYSLLYWLPFPGDVIWRLCGDICFVSVVCLPWQLFLAPVFRFSLNCFQQGLMAFLSAVSSSLLDLMALKIFYSLFFIALRDFSSLWVFPVWSIFRCVSRLWQSICRVALALILFFSARCKIVFPGSLCHTVLLMAQMIIGCHACYAWFFSFSSLD